MVRASLLFLLWGLLIFTEWLVFANPSFHREGEVRLKVLEVHAVDNSDDKLGRGSYVKYLVIPEDGSSFEQTQYTSYANAEYLERYPYSVESVENSEYLLYSLTGTGLRWGEPYGYYVSAQGGIFAQWEYFLCTKDAHAPVQTWAVVLSFIVALLLFLMGRRQITLSMKYPRSDVPIEVTGAPDIMYNEEYFHGLAEDAVREDMDMAAKIGLLTEDENEDDVQ